MNVPLYSRIESSLSLCRATKLFELRCGREEGYRLHCPTSSFQTWLAKKGTLVGFIHIIFIGFLYFLSFSLTTHLLFLLLALVAPFCHSARKFWSLERSMKKEGPKSTFRSKWILKMLRRYSEKANKFPTVISSGPRPVTQKSNIDVKVEQDHVEILRLRVSHKLGYIIFILEANLCVSFSIFYRETQQAHQRHISAQRSIRNIPMVKSSSKMSQFFE